MPLAYLVLALIYVYPNMAIFAKLGVDFLTPTYSGILIIGAILFVWITFLSPGKVTTENMGKLAHPDYIKRHYSSLERLSKLPTSKDKDGKSASPWPDFSDPVYNGLRDQDREKTSYGDEGR